MSETNQKVHRTLVGRVVSDNAGAFRPGDIVVMLPNAPTEQDEFIAENYLRSSRFCGSGFDGFMQESMVLPPERVVLRRRLAVLLWRAVAVLGLTLGLLGVRKSRAFNRAMSILLVSAFTFAVCFINPNAISMIYAISGPLIAMILFIMPTLSTWLIPALKPYRSVGNAITLVVGLLCVSVMFFG